MPLQPGASAPYTTGIAATTVLDAWRDRGFGVPVTPDTLVRVGVSESLARRTFQSLVLLDLIDDGGNPSEQFQAFRATRGEEEYRVRLQAWVRVVYADVLQYADPNAHSYEEVTEAFRTYEPAGQRRAMAGLLLGLWKYAGLPVTESKSPPSRKTPSPRARQTSRPKTSPREAIDGRPGFTPPAAIPAQNDLPAGLVGLLQQIPRDGRSWTSDRREAFVKAFEGVLDFSVPVDDNPPATEADEQEEPDS